MHRPSNILNAASNLLGIALVIIAGLNVAHMAAQSFADEVAWASAVLLALSCVLSYLALREGAAERYEIWADRVFLLGLFALFASIVVLAIERN
jgi:hypothetical protein